VEGQGEDGYSDYIEKANELHRSHIMNIAKNMEAIFFAAIALVSVTSFATADNAVRTAGPALAQQAEVPMHVVTVSAKRLTAAEKAALGQ
jgi:hypothetical protein